MFLFAEKISIPVNMLLLQNGFTTDDMKTRNFVVKEDKKYNEMTRTYIFDGFSFNQSATLKFDYDKDNKTINLKKGINDRIKVLSMLDIYTSDNSNNDFEK